MGPEGLQFGTVHVYLASLVARRGEDGISADETPPFPRQGMINGKLNLKWPNWDFEGNQIRNWLTRTEQTSDNEGGKKKGSEVQQTLAVETATILEKTSIKFHFVQSTFMQLLFKSLL